MSEPAHQLRVRGNEDDAIEKLESRIAKLEKWVWFVSGAGFVIGWLLGASGVLQKLLQ